MFAAAAAHQWLCIRNRICQVCDEWSTAGVSGIRATRKKGARTRTSGRRFREVHGGRQAGQALHARFSRRTGSAAGGQGACRARRLAAAAPPGRGGEGRRGGSAGRTHGRWRPICAPRFVITAEGRVRRSPRTARASSLPDPLRRSSSRRACAAEGPDRLCRDGASPSGTSDFCEFEGAAGGG